MCLIFILEEEKLKLMKRLAILFITVFTFVSCGEEVEFNTPAIQGTKDYVLWSAEYFNAAIDGNGYLTITGGNNIETLILKIPSAAVGTYNLGDVESMEGRFIAADGTVFSTNNRPDSDIYNEYGFIKLDEIINNTFTGRFEFDAYDEDGNVVNFGGVTEQQNPDNPNDTGEDPIGGGIFYRVPLTSGSFPSMVFTCVDAEEQTELLQAAFDATTAPDLTYVNSADYIMACEALAAALETQRLYCGDIGGTLQNEIDNLNACVFPCQIAVNNRNTAEAEFNSATIGNYISACLDYQLYLQEQIDFCGDTNGGIQLILDELDCGDDDSDGVPNFFEDFNGDGDLDNDDSDGDGIANYLDDDDDGDGVLTIHEAKDEDGNPIDTDGDGDVDYLDNDDDGDGILTANEDADPNMDGDPSDAVDTDTDGIPDYLDDM